MNGDQDTKRSSTSTGIGMALWMGERLPASIGYRIASLMAGATALRRGSDLMRAIRHNQAVVLNQQEDSRTIYEQSRRVLQNQARCLFDFYRLLDQPAVVVDKVSLSERLQQVLTEDRNNRSGLLLLTTHTSAFDLAGLSLAHRGFQPLVLGVPNPSRDYLHQYRLRSERGLLTLPMSISALGQARERLQAGGLVVTGLDRPLADARHQPCFFGRPSNLPVAYVRLGLRTNARVHIVACRDMPDGNYQIDCSDEIVFTPGPEPASELVENAEIALRAAQTFIEQDPSQWMMFFPVWDIPTQISGKG